MSKKRVNNEEYVYLFKGVSFRTMSGGATRDWCVSAIEIHLRENSIPEIVLHVDPAHTTADPMVPGMRVGLQDLSKWNVVIQTMAQNKDRANLAFEVWRKDEKEQAISLTDWIVTGGGLVTQGERFVFEIIIQHPLSACSLTGVTLGELADFQDVHTNQTIGTNIVEALVLSATNIAGAEVRQTAVSNNAKISADVRAAVKRAQTKLLKAAGVLSAYLKWDPLLYNDGSLPWSYEDWPQATQLQKSNLAYSSVISRYVWGMKDVNLWEILAHTIVDDWSVSIVPTFWTALTLTPTSPWLEPALVIDDIDIAGVNFPAYERSMVAGVYCPSQFPCGGLNYDHIQNAAFAMKYSTQAILYMPNDPNIEGLVLNMNQPQWLQALMYVDVSELQVNDNFGTNEQNGRLTTPCNVTFGKNTNDMDPTAIAAAADRAAGASYACANQFFLTQFRSGSQASIHTRLLLTYGSATTMGGYVLPGYVCRVKSGDVNVMDFYMTEIIHRINFDQGVADTTIAGKYVRPPEGFTNVAETGTPNPMWTKK